MMALVLQKRQKDHENEVCTPPNKKTKEKCEEECETEKTKTIEEKIKEECEKLGLQQEVIDYLSACQDMCPGHEPNLYYIKRLVEDKVNDCDVALTIKGKLKLIGFNEEKASDFEQTAENLLFGHRSLIEWIELYLDSLADSPATNTQQTPNYFTTKDMIFQINGTRTRTRWGFCFINEGDSGSLKVEIEQDLESHLTHSNFWYHGTTLTSMVSIKDTGINLGSGKRGKDFSNGFGFYLSEDFHSAAEWCLRGTIAYGRAVLVYKGEPSEGVKPFKALDLRHLDRRDDWRNFVKFNRSGGAFNITGMLNERQENYDYVIGPRSGDNEGGPRYQSRDDWNPVVDKDTVQLCITSTRMAQQYNKNLVAVAYLLP